MKKLIFKFKNWLIKKLGGHTDEEVTALFRQPPLVYKHNFQPIILRTEATCNETMLSNMTAREEVMERFLSTFVNQFGKELLVRIGWTDDIPSYIRTYRAELAVISPDDLRNAR